MINTEVLYSGFATFIVSVIAAPVFIPLLRRLKFGQNIREDGPKTHLIKSGTPTMGGIIILAVLLTVGIYFGRKYDIIYLALLFTFGCGLIGFIDDYIKVVLKRSLGFTAMQKMLALIFITTFFTLYYYNFVDPSSDIIIPFMKKTLELGPLYIPFIIFVILGTVNGVNITDGLDGLASGITAIVSIFFSVAAILYNDTGMAVFSAMLTGVCLGFLVFNIYPAKVFMGDTGSLALGGAVSAAAVILKLPAFLALSGGIYMLEILSVIIQVTWFKKTGKRLFKMAPLHHHYEIKGWKETKVVMFFWTITAALNVISLLALL